MDPDTIIFLPGFQIDTIEKLEDETIIIKAHSQAKKERCPSCSVESDRSHGWYSRKPQTLPIHGMKTILHLKVRRFVCNHPQCPRKTFAEAIEQVVPRFGRRSILLNQFLNSLAFETSAESAARICIKLNISISPDSILRYLRSTSILPSSRDVRILGVDDWAFKKNYSYGTILVDLESRRVIDLLPERTAERLASWLANHPEVKYVARDRSKEYRAGIKTALPKVIQIADRWYLLFNLRERIQRTLPGVLRKNLKNEGIEKFLSPASEQRKKMYDLVRYLYARGYSQRAIARALEISRGTVKNYIQSETFPDYLRGVPRPSKIDRYESYLRRRWTQGVHSSTQLWREIRVLGYDGKRKSVHRYLRRFREQHPARSLLQLTWLFIKDQAKLSNDEQDHLKYLFGWSKEAFSLYQLAQRFVSMIREKEVEQLEGWLLDAEDSGFKPMSNFAFGLRRDQNAVKNALLYPWSNGQTEGQVTRLKMIKRQMYGLANFDLLRIRILGPP